VRRYFVLAAAALAAAAASQSALAAPTSRAVHVAPARKQVAVAGFFRGKPITYFNFGPIKLRPGNKLAPLWAVTNGVAGQQNIVDTVPGQAGYSPLWAVRRVTFKAGVKPRLLISKANVFAAVKAGDATIVRTATVVNCPVLGFGQKRVAGYSGGHLVHYLDLGPVKVAPGNPVVPLYTVTNGVPGQKNVTGDTIAPGQTAYPPLWGILEVTWTRAATPRLLTSFAAIEKAKAAGEVTIKRTPLVVNCPLV
jgi:hypothetical protein